MDMRTSSQAKMNYRKSHQKKDVLHHCQTCMTASAQNTCPSTWSKERLAFAEMKVVEVALESSAKRAKCFCVFKSGIAMNTFTQKNYISHCLCQ